ncbi:MAG: DUF1501 domain-containing protein [Verrucomicrobiaceae bacterium]|nr:DUF1501 domain-containing protein [Verrucomicrobiaceae bacterium]
MPDPESPCAGHSDPHAFMFMNPRVRDGVVVHSRRSVLKTSLAGIGGLTLPGLVELRAAGKAVSSNKSVILLWMTGGPSHIDTWDPKSDMPSEIRGPFKTIPTKLPGTRICEYLPKQAAMLDKFTIIRSVDCRNSNHEPNMVMQTANRAAAPRINSKGHLYPAFGSVIAKERGPNHPGMPPYVVLNLKSRAHVAWGGYLGTQYDPFNGAVASQLFQLPKGLTMERLESRHTLNQQMDSLRRDLDASGMMEAMDSFSATAFDMVAGGRAQDAFDIAKEPQKVRDRYGDHDWAKQALLARRLVERGSSFVTIDLSNHSASGTWDNHGDNIPPYGGIWNGLRPLLPVFDHVITTLVSDLGERGMLDDTLVIAMGEFGRTPTLGTQGSSDGRNHWPYVMSMCLAGGGFRHGQVIGASSRDGGEIAERPVTPADLAATIYQHMGVPLNTTYNDHQGRPIYIVDGGAPLKELV